MSDKRFEIDIYTLPTTIVDSETSELYSSMISVVDLLNDLSEENERLKKEVENLQTNMMESLGEHRKYEKSLEEENEELTISIKLFEDDVKRLTEENEKLKQQLDKIPLKTKEIWLK